MSASKEHATILGVGVAACAACCAGPILAVLAALGLGTAVGFVLFGAVTVLIGAAVIVLVVLRRGRRNVGCTPRAVEPAPVEFSSTRSRATIDN
jgi:mercuric ion transport protein